VRSDRKGAAGATHLLASNAGPAHSTLSVQVGFKMFLGVTATVTAWNNETTVRSKSNAPGVFFAISLAHTASPAHTQRQPKFDDKKFCLRSDAAAYSM